MSTMEVLHSISDAIAAFEAKPGLERRIKTLEDDLGYAQLEIDELKRKLADQAETIRIKNEQLVEVTVQFERLHIEMADCRSENEALKESLRTQETISENRLNDWHAAVTMNEIHVATIADLNQRLYDARSYGERLAETLKSIGASIVSAVAVPEVTAEQPFQVSGTVELSVPADTGGNGDDVSVVEPVVAEPVGEDMVKSHEPILEQSVEPTNSPYKYW